MSSTSAFMLASASGTLRIAVQGRKPFLAFRARWHVLARLESVLLAVLFLHSDTLRHRVYDHRLEDNLGPHLGDTRPVERFEALHHGGEPSLDELTRLVSLVLLHDLLGRTLPLVRVVTGAPERRTCTDEARG